MWIEKDYRKSGRIYELSLEPKVVASIEIKTDEKIRLGLMLEKGHEISKSGGLVYLGTDRDPQAIGGSPGVSKLFEPEEGVIRARIENSSSIATKAVLYEMVDLE